MPPMWNYMLWLQRIVANDMQVIVIFSFINMYILNNNSYWKWLSFACRYVDVSTVDVTTSKLICGNIKATGALFLEVGTQVSYLNRTISNILNKEVVAVQCLLIPHIRTLKTLFLQKKL